MAKSRRIAYKRKRKESKKARKPLRKQKLQLYRCFSFSSRYCIRFGDNYLSSWKLRENIW